MDKTRILYVSSEINPFLNTSIVADYVRKLPQAMQEKGMEIRILVPRFGLINERKNRLHEVVRLSGINIPVGDDEKPLIIKVASIPNAKLQVYFIDNEDYFQRKTVFYDKENRFYDDNDERTIFFCKGVIETVKKLGWAPDIVHCNDWVTSLIPLYLKSIYRDEPIFSNTKTVFTIYNNPFNYQFNGDFIDKVKSGNIEDSMVKDLKSGDFRGFVKTGAEFADRVVKAEEDYNETLSSLYQEIEQEKNTELPLIQPEDENIFESYYKLYSDLVKN